MFQSGSFSPFPAGSLKEFFFPNVYWEILEINLTKLWGAPLCLCPLTFFLSSCPHWASNNSLIIVSSFSAPHWFMRRCPLMSLCSHKLYLSVCISNPCLPRVLTSLMDPGLFSLFSFYLLLRWCGDFRAPYM